MIKYFVQKKPNNLKKRGFILDYSYRRVESITGREGIVSGAESREITFHSHTEKKTLEFMNLHRPSLMT